MPTVQRPISSRQGSLSALTLCFLMLFVSASPMVAPAPKFSISATSHSTYYTPQANETGLNLTSTGVLNIPYNQTFTGGQLSITPMWTEAPDTSAGLALMPIRGGAERMTARRALATAVN